MYLCHSAIFEDIDPKLGTGMTLDLSKAPGKNQVNRVENRRENEISIHRGCTTGTKVTFSFAIPPFSKILTPDLTRVSLRALGRVTGRMGSISWKTGK